MTEQHPQPPQPGKPGASEQTEQTEQTGEPGEPGEPGASGESGESGSAQRIPIPGGHPRHALSPLLNAPVRLSVVAALAPVHRAEFGFVRDLVEVTDSALSKQVAGLEEAGLVAVDKGRVGRRPRTWLSLTEEGREVYGRHLAALRAIADGLGAPAPPPPWAEIKSLDPADGAS
ncbi:winged helix-turn-helix domain-containing protein [Streptomyces sp. NPDC094448]|uniref:winged helix-turn-helix domain-containing protein n=1 Tax=Streptomyces sp. NPDC094448 TaxID=3366063 RepID=UPI0038005201